MKKTKANGKRPPKQQHDKGIIHVRLYLTMMETPAWRSLDGNARALYIEIAARYRGNNNGRISFSMREASKAIHVRCHTALRKFRQLQERGFIVETVKGSYGGQRRASRWRADRVRMRRNRRVGHVGFYAVAQFSRCNRDI